MATAIPTAKDTSLEEIEELLEARKNGMGLQKAAKKYDVGVSKIRRIERENGMEVVPTTTVAKNWQQLPIKDLQKHFQEVQESFAIIVEDLPNTKTELLDKLHTEEDVVLEKMEEEAMEEMKEEMEDVQEKIGWQIENATLFGVVGLVVAVFALLLQQKPAPIRYYTHPCM